MQIEINLEDWEKRSEEHQKQYKYLLDKGDKKKLLKKLPDLHEAAFEKVDCLQCANCCKNYSPRFKMPDIKRISKPMRMKETEFIDTYLTMDKEGDYVTKTSPCPFLGADNYCSVYEARPNACREYPHTDQRKIHTIYKETLNNIAICPAVFEIVEKLKNVL